MNYKNAKKNVKIVISIQQFIPEPGFTQYGKHPILELNLKKKSPQKI